MSNTVDAPFYTVSSDYSFNDSTLADRVFTTGRAAWQALAVDYALTDAGFDPMPDARAIGERDTAGRYKTADGETVRVILRSTHGVHSGRHVWVSEDGGHSCLACGATYRDGDVDAGQFVGCTGDTTMVHGDPTESGHSLTCTAYAEDDTCTHVMHACDCASCS